MKLTFFKNKEQTVGTCKDISIAEIYNLVSDFKSIRKEAQEAYIAGTLENDNRSAASKMLTRSMITLDIDKTNMSIDELSNSIPNTHIIYTTYSNSDESHSYRVLIPIATEIAADNYNTIANNYAKNINDVDPSSYRPKQLMFFGGAKDIQRAEAKLVTKDILDPFYFTDEVFRIKEALLKLDANDYNLWIRTGIALYNSYGDKGLLLFDQWSKTADNYGQVKTKWESFNTNDKKRFVSSIFYDAKMEFKTVDVQFDNIEYKHLGKKAEIYEKYYGKDFNLKMNSILDATEDWRNLFFKFKKETFGVIYTYFDKKVEKSICISFENGCYTVKLTEDKNVVRSITEKYLFDVIVGYGQVYANVFTQLPVIPEMIEDFIKVGIPLKFNYTLKDNYEIDNTNYTLRLANTFKMLGLNIKMDYIRSSSIYINDKIVNIDSDSLMTYLKNKIQVDMGKFDFEPNFKAILMDTQFNPFVTMVKSIKWDGVNRIDEFVDAFKINNDQYEDFKYFLPRYLSQLFCLHMDGTVEWDEYKTNYYRKFNRNILAKAEAVLILIGAQGLSKSTAISSFLPHNMNQYIGSQYINFKGSNAVDTFKIDYLICELGEIDTFIAKHAEELKNFLSQSEYIGRASYGKLPTLTKRKTLFYGTSNHRSILKDITGSRRFLCVDIEENLNIKHKDKFMQQLWAELYHKVLNFDITPFIDKVFNQTTYRYQSVTEENILEYYELADYKDGKAISERQIFNKISHNQFDTYNKFDDIKKGQINRALTALRVKIKKQNGTILYWLKEKVAK